jgi:hypothetical protein
MYERKIGHSEKFFQITISKTEISKLKRWRAFHYAFLNHIKDIWRSDNGVVDIQECSNSSLRKSG